MKRLAALILIFPMLLSGCWDLTEPEKLGLVTVVGVDLAGNNNIKVIIHEAKAQRQAGIGSAGGGGGGGGGQTPFFVHMGTGSTIFEAVQVISSENNRRTFFAHTRAIVFSEELARSRGIKPIIDFFERNPEFRRNTWLLIAKNRQLDKILTINTTLGVNNGDILEDIIRNRQRNSLLAANRLGDFIELFEESGSDPYTAGVEAVEGNIVGGTGSDGGGTRESGKANDLKIADTAVFRGDKLAGWLEGRENRGLLWVKGKVKGGVLTTTYEGKELSLQILRMKSKVKPVITGGKMQINIRVDVETNVGESQADLDFSKKEVIEKIQQLQNEEVKKEIFMALDKSRNLGTDVFGFGRHFHASYPEYWKQIKDKWYDYYPNINVNIEVNSIIRHIGLITMPAEKTKLDSK